MKLNRRQRRNDQWRLKHGYLIVVDADGVQHWVSPPHMERYRITPQELANLRYKVGA